MERITPDIVDQVVREYVADRVKKLLVPSWGETEKETDQFPIDDEMISSIMFADINFRSPRASFHHYCLKLIHRIDTQFPEGPIIKSTMIRFPIGKPANDFMVTQMVQNPGGSFNFPKVTSPKGVHELVIPVLIQLHQQYPDKFPDILLLLNEEHNKLMLEDDNIA